MHTCADCHAKGCNLEGRPDMPKNCPMHDDAFMNEALREYSKPENNKFFLKAAEVEAKGYCVWPRVKEAAEFCSRMGYKKVGMAFCSGLRKEAKVIAQLLRDYGLEVVSVICKTGGYSKGAVGIPDELRVRGGQFEPMCNPIAQAELLNRQNTEFNVAVGLCVGHDSLFAKYSKPMVTTVLIKDRALGNNPVQAVYCDTYMRRRLAKEDTGWSL